MNKFLSAPVIAAFLLFMITFSSCSDRERKLSDEQINITTDSEDTTSVQDSSNSVSGNSTMKQLRTFPNNVILTGLNEHRLVSIYKSKKKPAEDASRSLKFYSSDYESGGDENVEHYMPGIDILYGYNLLNVAHYNLKTETMNHLFSRPVLVKTLYYPSFVQDSVDKKPINRNYYMVSVYDEDTNKDTLLNKKDLRRFYHFDAEGRVKTAVIPSDYSVVRSQYDSKNDLMYIFARYDENKNGTQDTAEPLHIFWINLKAPAKAKRLY